MGIHLAVPDSLSRVEWFGKGPHECYPDRKFGAWLRRHHVAHASELHVPYIFPGPTSCIRSDLSCRVWHLPVASWSAKTSRGCIFPGMACTQLVCTLQQALHVVSK